MNAKLNQVAAAYAAPRANWNLAVAALAARGVLSATSAEYLEDDDQDAEVTDGFAAALIDQIDADRRDIERAVAWERRQMIEGVTGQPVHQPYRAIQLGSLGLHSFSSDEDIDACILRVELERQSQDVRAKHWFLTEEYKPVDTSWQNVHKELRAILTDVIAQEKQGTLFPKLRTNTAVQEERPTFTTTREGVQQLSNVISEIYTAGDGEAFERWMSEFRIEGGSNHTARQTIAAVLHMVQKSAEWARNVPAQDATRGDME